MATLAEIPFGPVDPQELFGFTSDGPGAEHTRFGWCRLAGVELHSEDQAIWVEAPLVLGLHSPDEEVIPVPVRGGVPRDINLEFVVSEKDALVGLLSEFLRERVPGLIGDARAIVLALCNPRRARISRPPELRGARVYYGVGEVLAWLMRRPDVEGWSLDEEAFVRLGSERWYSC